jgi:hypothetical protein
MIFQSPEKYMGGMRSGEWKNQTHINIVNGHVQKCDCNFISEFHITKLPNTNIYIGSYPSTKEDIEKINGLGINAILSLLNQDDLDVL